MPVDSSGDAGTNVFYQGFGLPDVRVGYQPGVTGSGRIRALLSSSVIEVVNAIPSAAGAAKIAAAQAVTASSATAGTALTLVAASSAGIVPNTPMLPNGASSTSGVVKALAIDPGFTTCNTTAGSAIIVMAAVAQYPRMVPGLTLAIAGGAAATWILASVVSITGTSVTLSLPMGATVTGAPVAVANGAFRNDETSTSLVPILSAGAAALFDARSGIARGISVTSSAADTTFSVIVRGYDIYGYPMAETIAVGSIATVYGLKAWKYITSVTPIKTGGGTSAGTISIGVSDAFGFAVRADLWEYLNTHYAGAAITVSTGFVAPDLTSPATGSTGDVRGTFGIGTLNAAGAGMAGGATDGARRLIISVRLPMDNLVMATVRNPVPMFGVTQFTV